MVVPSFGKYEVTNLLGRGGMAEVYKGYHPDLDRHVAIKVILPHFASHEGFDERFRREARLVASLRHPHIVHLYDFDVLDGRMFMVMEHLNGGTLKDYMRHHFARGRGVPIEEIARLLEALAAALDYAHARGAVHRDIKPANILFTAQREPVLTDFGIAKLLDDAAQLTMTGRIVGSPAYMAPEQAAGGAVDARSDLYALGIVVYEMATGRVPFQGDSPSVVLVKHLNEAPPPPRTLNPHLAEAVEAVMLKALAKDPNARFASAGELARALREALNSHPTVAPGSDMADAATRVDSTPAAASDFEATLPDSAPMTNDGSSGDQVSDTWHDAPTIASPTAVSSMIADVALTVAETAAPMRSRIEAPAFPLIGRESELAQLRQIWQAVCSGQGHTIFVTGEAGMGKSTLVDAFIAQLVAEQGNSPVQIARGRCSQQFGREEAFLPFAETLADLLENEATSQQSALQLYNVVHDTAPAWMDIVPVVGDMLGRMLDKAKAMQQQFGSPETTADQQHMLKQYTNALLALAGRAPVLLFLDDLHWADSATVTLLAHLARQITAHPILLIGTYRPSDLAVSNNPLRQARRDLDRYKVCTEIALTTFDRAGFDALVSDSLPGHALPERFLQQLYTETGGVPFFIAETFTYLKDSGDIQEVDGTWQLVAEIEEIELPTSVEAVIEKRLERLEEGLRRALQYASVEGDEFTSTVVARLLETDELTLEEQLERVEQVHQLVRFAGEVAVGDELASRYQYSHAFFRKVLYESLQGKRLRLLHRRVGEALETLHGADAEPIAHQLAYHFEIGHVPDKALTYSLRAAQRAMRLYAWDEAEFGFERARRLAEHAEDPDVIALQVAEGLGDIALARAQYKDALGHYDSALETLDLALVDDEEEWRARLHRKRSRTYEYLGELQAAFEALEEGLRYAPDDSLELVALHIMGAGLCHRQGRYREALAWCQTALTFKALPKVHPLRAHAESLTGVMHTYLGNPGEALKPLELALKIYNRLDNLQGQCDVYSNLGLAYFTRAERGDWERSRDCDRQASMLAERMNDRERIARIHNDLGWTSFCLGDTEGAIRACKYSLDIWTQNDARLMRAIVCSNLGAIELARNNHISAFKYLNEAVAILEEVEAHGQLAESRRYLALAHFVAGNLGVGMQEAKVALELSRSVEAPLDEAATQRVLGQIALAVGDLDTAAETLEISQSSLEALGNRYELAQTLTVQAELHLRKGDAASAAALVDRAIDIFSDLGAARELRRAQELAQAILEADESIHRLAKQAG